MKNRNVGALRRAIEAGDSLSCLWFCRIAQRRQHDTSRRIRRPFNNLPSQSGIDDALKDLSQVRLQSHQDCLCLRIPKTHIVFEHTWAVRHEHQTYEKYSTKRKAIIAATLQTGFHNLTNDALEGFAVDDAFIS